MQTDFKNFDWDGLIKSLPIKKTEEDRAKKEKIVGCYGYEQKWIFISCRI